MVKVSPREVLAELSFIMDELTRARRAPYMAHTSGHDRPSRGTITLLVPDPATIGWNGVS